MNPITSIHDTPGSDDSAKGAKQSLFNRIAAYPKRFRLGTLLTIAFVFIVVSAVGITALIGFLNCESVAGNLAGHLSDTDSELIIQHLDTYLTTPHQINQLQSDSIRLGQVPIRDQERLKLHFLELSYRFPTIEAFCYANQEDGDYSIVSSVGGMGVANETERFWGISSEFTNHSFDEFLINREGQVITKTLSLPDYDPRTRPWYQAAVDAEGPVWTPVYIWLEGVVSIDAVLPVYTDSGGLRGVLDTALTLSGIGEYLKNLTSSEEEIAIIIERSGLLIATSTDQNIFKEKNGELIRLFIQDTRDPVLEKIASHLFSGDGKREEITERQQFLSDIQGTRYLVTITPYQDPYGLDWLIILVFPESEYLGDVAKQNAVIAFLIIISIIGTSLVCILLARWITKPITVMNEHAKKIASGKWVYWNEPDRHDELGELWRSFKSMADQLQATFTSLKLSEERYYSLFESSADALLLLLGFHPVAINRAGIEMFGMSGEEIQTKDIRELFFEVGTCIGEMIESFDIVPGKEFEEKTLSRPEKGDERFLNIRLTRIPAEESSLFLAHIRDITDERKAIITIAEQKVLRESYARINMILTHLPDPTFVIDEKGTVLFWNKAIEEMTHVRSEDIIGKGDYIYGEALYGEKRPVLIDFALHPELSDNTLYPIIERSEDLFMAHIWFRKREKRRFFSIFASPLYNQEGIVIGAIESVRDITPLKMAEDGLLLANKKLSLLSSVTRHDIVNKVMISNAYLHFLLESLSDPEQAHAAAGIKSSLDEIETIISFTRIYEELGSSVPVWQDVAEKFRSAANNLDCTDVTIEIAIADIFILADPLFEKVCYNLLENALRHGETLTRITITATELSDRLQILVRDNGKGVPDDEKERIFKRGFGKNTGYGLFLVREILSLSHITIAEKGSYGNSCIMILEVLRDHFRRGDGS
ncbi:MAG: PAS domain S-box protein [Methanospirillaceae archaeon]|nr:PAS domain S-box protein [Methanospirillaceae archaeon]